MKNGFINRHEILTGVDARRKAGYPEALKEIMMFISWEMDVVISTRVGNPPRIDIPVLESTKATDIKTKTAPSSKTKDDLFIVSPARGTIIVDQEIFGKTDSAEVPKGEGYHHVPYPATLRDLLKQAEENMLDVKMVGDEIHFEAKNDYKPVAHGHYDHGKLKFTKSENPPSLTYSIKLADLDQKEIDGIFHVALTETDKKKLSPWKNNLELEQKSKSFLKDNNIRDDVLDKPVPLYYRHGDNQKFKVLEVVAKDNAIVIGDDDTLSMSPSLAFLNFIKTKYPNNPHIVHELMDTMGDFNKNPKQTAKRLFMIERLLCEYNIERLSVDRASEILQWKMKLYALNNMQDPEKFYLDKYYKNGKFANIDSCGNDGMSAFELMISINVNERFHTELQHIGQFIQHPPELRNHTVPSSLEDKAMHIWNGRFVLTNDENGLIAFYCQQNEGRTYAEKFPLLADHFVEISPVWLEREYKNEKGKLLSVGADKWWPVIAIQMALGQTDLMDKATLAAYNNYVNSKPELAKLDIPARAAVAEKQLNEQAQISELSDLINPNRLVEKSSKPAATAKDKTDDTKSILHSMLAKKLYIVKNALTHSKSASFDRKSQDKEQKATNDSTINRFKRSG